MYRILGSSRMLFYSITPLPNLIATATQLRQLTPLTAAIFHEQRRHLPLFLRQVRLLTLKEPPPQHLQYLRQVSYRVGECSSELTLTSPELIELLLFRSSTNHLLSITEGTGFEYRATLLATSHLAGGKASFPQAVTFLFTLSQTSSLSLPFLAKFTGCLKHHLKTHSRPSLPLLLTILDVYLSKGNRTVLEDVMAGLCLESLAGRWQEIVEGQRMEEIVELLRVVLAVDVRGMYAVSIRERSGMVEGLLRRLGDEGRTGAGEEGRRRQLLELCITAAESVQALHPKHPLVDKIEKYIETALDHCMRVETSQQENNFQFVLELLRLQLTILRTPQPRSHHTPFFDLVAYLVQTPSTLVIAQEYFIFLFHRLPPAEQPTLLPILRLIHNHTLPTLHGGIACILAQHQPYHIHAILQEYQKILNDSQEKASIREILVVKLLCLIGRIKKMDIQTAFTSRVDSALETVSPSQLLSPLHQLITQIGCSSTSSLLLIALLGSRPTLLTTVHSEDPLPTLYLILQLLSSDSALPPLHKQNLLNLTRSIPEHTHYQLILQLFPSPKRSLSFLMEEVERFVPKFAALQEILKRPKFHYLLWDLFRKCYLGLPAATRREAFPLLSTTFSAALHEERQRKVVMLVGLVRYVAAGWVEAPQTELKKLFWEGLKAVLAQTENSDNFHYRCFEEVVRHGLGSGVMELDQVNAVVELGQRGRRKLHDRCMLMMLFGGVVQRQEGDKKKGDKWRWARVLGGQERYIRQALRQRRILVGEATGGKEGIITAGVEYVSVLLMWDMPQMAYLYPSIAQMIVECEEVQDFTLLALSYSPTHPTGQKQRVGMALRSKLEEMREERGLRGQLGQLIESRLSPTHS